MLLLSLVCGFFAYRHTNTARGTSARLRLHGGLEKLNPVLIRLCEERPKTGRG